MTSSTAIREARACLFFCAVLLPGQEKPKEQAMKWMPEKKQTVFAVAKLNGKSKVINGKRHDLVVTAVSAGLEFLITDSTSVVMLVNGKSAWWTTSTHTVIGGLW